MSERQSPTAAPKGADRVLAVFKELAVHPRGIALEQLAVRVASPKSSVHRALAALRRAGLADHDERGTYRLGLEALQLAFAYYEKLDERVIVQPVLDALAARFQETVHYAVLDGGQIVYLAKVEQRDQSVYMSSRIGGRNPAHCTGVGKALLAHALPSLDEVRRYAADHPLERRTANTLVTPEALGEDLQAIRERGYAIDREENEPGIACVALPVFLGPGPAPRGAISVTTLTHRTPLERLIEGVDEMRSIIGAGLLPSREADVRRSTP
jgi:IclR family transcriptional regulator, acetate operon repressor